MKVAEGQVFYDEMYDYEVEITSVGEDVITIREKDLIEQKGDVGGNAYFKELFYDAVDNGRFKLIDDVPESEKTEIISQEENSLFTF